MGVLERWVLLQQKAEKDTLILDTCNIISFCYFLLRKEVKRKNCHSGKRERLSFKVSTASESLVWVSFEGAFCYRNRKKRTPETL